MGFKDWVRRHLGWFDRQIENYPSEARRPAPPVRRGPLGTPGPTATPGPAGRRTPPPAPPAAPRAARHRLGEPHRRPDSDTDIDPTFGQAITSATPYWIDEPGHHDHRHHGHSGAAEHRTEDAPSGYTTHHGGHNHTSHDFGGGSHHSTSHDWGGGGGGYGGSGGANCGSGGGD